MSSFSAAEGAESVVHSCNTCKAIFSSIEKVKEHYRGEWHIFNSKRRAHDMAPLTKSDFKAVIAARSMPTPTQPAMSHMDKMISSAPWNGTGGTGNITAGNIGSLSNASKVTVGASTATGSAGVISRNQSVKNASKQPVGADNNAAVELSWGGITAASVEELRQSALQIGIAQDRVESIVQLAVERRTQEEARNERRRTAFLEREKKSAEARGESVDVASSIDAMEANMEEQGTVGESEAEEEAAPALGANVSIFDDREFESTEECVEYMEKEFGFFLPDRDCICDLDGLLEYLGDKVKLGGFCLYCQKQLRPGRPCQMHMISTSHCKIAYAEGIDLDEYDDFYDFTAENADLPVDEDGNPIEQVAQISSTGELILPNGRVVGHRAYKHYYKQRFAPVDSRPAVLAAQREQLLRLGIAVGADYTEDSIVAMPDVQVLTLLVRHQKLHRRELAYQQRARQKDEMRAKRHDHALKASKLRSSEQRTQIIRDYHGGLM